MFKRALLLGLVKVKPRECPAKRGFTVVDNSANQEKIERYLSVLHLYKFLDYRVYPTYAAGCKRGWHRAAAQVGSACGRWAERVALAQWVGQWAKQMRQPYDIICAALFAFYPLCEECRVPSAEWLHQWTTSNGIIGRSGGRGGGGGRTASASCSSASSTQSKYLHNVQLYACASLPACVCVCVCVICGWQRATAALGMFTLQNAITAATAADDKENRTGERERERGRGGRQERSGGCRRC